MSWGPFDLLRPLFDFLICLVKYLAGTILALLIGLANLLLAGLMALLGPLLSLFPMVDLPAFSAPAWLNGANWLLPVDQFVILVPLVLILLAAWHVAQIGLRWLKVVR